MNCSTLVWAFEMIGVVFKMSCEDIWRVMSEEELHVGVYG